MSYNLIERRLEDSGYNGVLLYLNSAVENGIITTHEVDCIKKHFRRKHAKNGKLSVARMKKISSHLVCWREHYGINKEYTVCTFDDIESALFEFDKSISTKGKKLKVNTIRDYKSILKDFLKFLIDENESDIKEGSLKNIKIPKADKRTKTNDDIPTVKEIYAMIKAARTVRDKAMLNMMYEGGFRGGEIREMKWNQIELSDKEAIVHVNFKTDKPRDIILMDCVDYLRRWKNEYPLDPYGENFVFLKKDNQPMGYDAFFSLFKDIMKRAGIKKKYTPHSFRHARVTELIRGDFPIDILKKMIWGNINTDEYDTYLHLTKKDMKRALCKFNNISYSDEDTDANNSLKVSECTLCGHLNPGTYRICSECGNPLDSYYNKEDQYHFIKVIENTSEYENIVNLVQNEVKVL